MLKKEIISRVAYTVFMIFSSAVMGTIVLSVIYIRIPNHWQSLMSLVLKILGSIVYSALTGAGLGASGFFFVLGISIAIAGNPNDFFLRLGWLLLRIIFFATIIIGLYVQLTEHQFELMSTILSVVAIFSFIFPKKGFEQLTVQINEKLKKWSEK